MVDTILRNVDAFGFAAHPRQDSQRATEAARSIASLNKRSQVAKDLFDEASDQAKAARKNKRGMPFGTMQTTNLQYAEHPPYSKDTDHGQGANQEPNAQIEQGPLVEMKP